VIASGYRSMAMMAALMQQGIIIVDGTATVQPETMDFSTSVFGFNDPVPTATESRADRRGAQYKNELAHRRGMTHRKKGKT
jgi:hypothetical protein